MLKQFASSLQYLRNWLFGNESSENLEPVHDHVPLILFFICIIFYSLYLLLMQPEWILGGEMWVEMATNYYTNSNAPALAQKLFSVDAGYIPLPQRLLALIGSSLSFPAGVVPYFYTWSAILITGAMVGVFCLKPFRILVANDFLRFLAAVAILMIADFETRTFVNFTYFVTFFGAILTSLALVQKSEDVPRWAWFLPILMVSKPAVLSILPAMVLVATVAGVRFRLVVAVVILVCGAQMLRMAFSHSEGVFVPGNHFGLIDKFYASLKYFIGFLGAFLVGKGVAIENYRPILFGAFLLPACLLFVFIRRERANALIVVGLTVLFFNVALNCFALSDAWNIYMERLLGAPLYRHIIGGYFAVIMIVVGLIGALTNRKETILNKIFFRCAPVFFLAWFFLSGWFEFSGKLNRPLEFPVVDGSQWQKMASKIESSDSVCIPIDPLGWVYGKNCKLLNQEDVTWNGQFGYKRLSADSDFRVKLDLPAALSNKNLLSLAVAIKARAVSPVLVEGKAVLNMKDGGKQYLVGDRQLPASGGLLMLTMAGTVPIGDIQDITFEFSVPVEAGFIPDELGQKWTVLWMGKS